MDVKEIGEIGNMQIEWRISNFFSAAEKLERCASPTFSLADVAWHLSLCTNNTAESKKGINVFLMSDVKRDYSVEYHFGLKKCCGTVEQLVCGILKKKVKCTAEIFLIDKSELQRRKSEFAPCDILTIICMLNIVNEVNDSMQKSVLQTGPLKLINLNKLSESFKDLLANKESCDVTLKVKDKEFRAHRSVLTARSSVLAANFKHDMLENQTGVITIEDCDPDSFEEFLEYLYCGKLTVLSIHSAMNLYSTSDKYDVKEIKMFCVEYILQCFDIENICDIAEFADKYDEIQLSGVVQEFFIENSFKILLTSGWECLMKSNYRLANKLLTEMAKLKLKE